MIQNPQLLDAQLINFVRAGGAANGSTAYTGVGFRPRVIIMGLMHGASRSISIGGAGADLANFSISLNPTGATAGTALGLLFTDSNFNAGQQCALSSYDIDGFTLAWTRPGAGLGAGDLYGWALCLR